MVCIASTDIIDNLYAELLYATARHNCTKGVNA